MTFALGEDIVVDLPGTGGDDRERAVIGDAISIMRAYSVHEGVRVGRSTHWGGTFNPVLVTGLSIRDKLRRADAELLSETLEGSLQLIPQPAYHARDHASMSESAQAKRLRAILTLEAVLLRDILDKGIPAQADEQIAVAISASARLRVITHAIESLEIEPDVAPMLVVRAVLSDGVELEPQHLLQLLLKPQLVEGVAVTGGLALPGESFVTWVTNLRTTAMTEYKAYHFNSYAQIGQRYLGAADTGLYELTGGDDAGDPIKTFLASGFQQFAGSRLSGFAAAYMGVRGEGEVTFRLVTNDGRTYDYRVVLQDAETTKIRLGKGLRARYFAFELVTHGQDFDLDDVEFVPIGFQRRV